MSSTGATSASFHEQIMVNRKADGLEVDYYS